ncbi:MAG: FliO/MopB family protein [Bdellovibrionales bacterium]
MMMRFTVVILSALLCFSAHAQTAASDKDSDEAIVAAAEKLVGEGKLLKTEEVKSEPSGEAEEAAVATAASITEGATKSAATVTPTATITDIGQEAKKESEIPVFAKSEKVAKSESSLLWRLFGSMAVLCIVAAGLIFVTKRWTKAKTTGGEKVRIEVLHRYQLSPKNSLALIRVAGEAILIGCTDQSVNMLKTVTLIDDELEGLLGKDFNGFLEDDFKIEDMRTALQPRV